jgi:hypothetical protein
MATVVAIIALALLAYVAYVLRKMSDNFAKWATHDLRRKHG